MVIEELDPADAAEWDEYVSAKAAANCYHLHGWRTAGERGYRLRAPYLVARSRPRGELLGALPLFFVRSPPLRGYATTVSSDRTGRCSRKTPGSPRSCSGKAAGARAMRGSPRFPFARSLGRRHAAALAIAGRGLGRDPRQGAEPRPQGARVRARGAPGPTGHGGVL